MMRMLTHGRSRGGAMTLTANPGHCNDEPFDRNRGGADTRRLCKQ